MSRSFVKHVVFGHGRHGSDSYHKRRASKKFRRINRERIKKGVDYDELELLTDLNSVSDLWDFSSDGKSYLGIMRAMKMIPRKDILFEDLFRHYYHFVGK